MATWGCILQRKNLMLMYLFFIRREYPPQETQKEEEKDEERDHWPDGDVVDILKNVFVHDRKCMRLR